VRREDGDGIARAHQGDGEVADERPRGVAWKSRVGLGEKEKSQIGSSRWISTHAGAAKIGHHFRTA
jgi:hypothetical protein